ncbi:TetR/AcrR family transcriptional regulator [Gammaproteobacteria bacterium]|nr:TetR/AcrR family transcriptional regulator [Pseudomonadota bacterium]MDC0185788.1 TetR/AcrR family transcriptional regulator [Gammaproteobacteria bacterium]|tara:strand:- start:134 stop:718 length:585 start_codon:yes stop_codon:yes gene_type:complete
MNTEYLRKKPKQMRSKLMFDNILEASTRVLEEVSFEKFTTNRVAEAAGISIGSLYQYFPNKQSILIELERIAIDKMTENIEILLFEENHTSQDRLFKVIEYFLITDSALYDNPFTANTEYSMQINKIKESLDFFLKSNKFIDEVSDDFLADYIVMLIGGIGSRLGKRNDIKDLDPYIEITFNSVMLSINTYQDK